MKHIESVTSLSEYIDVVDALVSKYTISGSPRFLFRGHSDHQNYKFIPGIFRTISNDNINYKYIRPYNQDEKTVLNEYIESSSRDLNNKKEWLEIAQHYQAPTRLLDLTEDALVALYFACEQDNGKGHDLSVWIINETNYTDYFFDQEFSVNKTFSTDIIVEKIINDELFKHDPEPHVDRNQYVMLPYIYKPVWKDQREINQKSWFMIWGAYQFEFDKIIYKDHRNEICLDSNIHPNENSILGLIKIPNCFREEILSELNSCGYTKDFIYPTPCDYGVIVKRNNYNPNNQQYQSYQSGPVGIILRDVNPTKDSWQHDNNINNANNND